MVSDVADGSPVGCLTSPWYEPYLDCNIALVHVSVELSDIGAVGSLFGCPLSTLVNRGPLTGREVPFWPSVNPNARELAHARGEDATL